ncbi:MAG: hypothetical protein H0T43_06940 [Solirubrobacterales bacterium]|nr:hypothetical protein [Solirubrobacterales bacterium]
MTSFLRIPPRARAALLVLVTAGLLAACGSDDPPPASDPGGAATTREGSGDEPRRGASEEFEGVPAPSGPGKAAFARFVDRVCTRFRKTGAETEGDGLARTRRVADLVRGAVAELSGPPVPRRDADIFRDYLALLGEQSDLLGELADAAARGDRGAIASVGRRIDDVGRRARARARAYGLRVCGSA